MKCTWIVQNVFDEKRSTFHTHGLNRYGSLELELNLPMEPNQATRFINLIADRVSKGMKYASGDKVTDIFTLPFYLFETQPIFGEMYERVLRIVFPDPQVKYPWDAGCDPVYAKQLSDWEIARMKIILRNGGQIS